MMKQVLIGIVSFLVAWFLRIWFATCRITVHGSEFRTMMDEQSKAVIAIFWHYSLVYVFYHLRTDSAAVLVSASDDGDYIAALAKNLNFNAVRGSRNRRGMRALKELIDCLKRGEHVGIVADGSQGPPLVVQAGAILMASRTGSPILPLTWAASHYFSFRSWDRTALPLPFSHIHFCYGEPFTVPTDLDGDDIERYRKELEIQMNDLYHQAWSLYDKEEH